MSTIAKMNVQSVREFGDASLIMLNCAYEHDGLNTEKWEDRRFTKATPWGEGQLTTPRPRDFEQGAAFYLVFNGGDDPNYRPRPDASLNIFVRAQRVEPWPGTTALEIVKDRKREAEAAGNPNTALNLRLSIDNPAAAEQFAEGKGFFLSFYRADRVTLAEAAAGE